MHIVLLSLTLKDALTQTRDYTTNNNHMCTDPYVTFSQLAVQKAEEYIATVYLKLKVLSSYGLALSISSLYYNFEGTPSITLKVMLDDLKARIQLSLLCES